MTACMQGFVGGEWRATFPGYHYHYIYHFIVMMIHIAYGDSSKLSKLSQFPILLSFKLRGLSKTGTQIIIKILFIPLPPPSIFFY